jgi:hypothetical protein
MDPNAKDVDVPTGLAHFALIRAGGQHALESSEPLLQKMKPQLEFLGWALAALYEVGTCNRKCWGGPHLLEALCVRVYNLGVSAYLLTARGFYDEALNLVRSVGEIGNLISLVASEDNIIPAWVGADKATRIREFGPGAVRRRLKQSKGVLIAPPDWYAEFCDAYTHPTPGIIPNMHNSTGLGYAGGVVQEEGLTKTLDEIIGKVGAIALMAAAFAQLQDYKERLSALVEHLRSADATDV